MHKQCEEALTEIEKEPDEEVLLIRTIKNQNKEQKSRQDFD